ncbi:MAG TPA: response regulator [Zoogloea sp.]|jgi:DNA-binding response OmpR family regulator|uniref:response regulator n=1 Tax=Zoogloea sp. TaxID=49181 RepID=UPI002C414F34|nr:response regulator [Zoogloea sp.]
MRILLVEDDRMLGDGVQAGLGAAGFTVDWVRDGEAALAALAGEGFAAVLLDLGLPRRDGLSVLASLRSAGNAVPVMILTARDQISDKVRGLDLGADDYMVKPFDLDELAARLRALVRRSSGRADACLRHGELVIDPAARTVTLRGEAVSLTGREFDLLSVLLDAAGRVLTRRVLEEQLYTWGEAVESNALEVHIHHLRRKLGSELIRTVRGVGYLIDEAPR